MLVPRAPFGRRRVMNDEFHADNPSLAYQVIQANIDDLYDVVDGSVSGGSSADGGTMMAFAFMMAET